MLDAGRCTVGDPSLKLGGGWRVVVGGWPKVDGGRRMLRDVWCLVFDARRRMHGA